MACYVCADVRAESNALPFLVNRGFSIHLEQQNQIMTMIYHPMMACYASILRRNHPITHRTTCLCTVKIPAKQPPLECHRWPDKRIVGTKSCCNLKSILVIHRTPVHSIASHVGEDWLPSSARIAYEFNLDDD